MGDSGGCVLRGEEEVLFDGLIRADWAVAVGEFGGFSVEAGRTVGGVDFLVGCRKKQGDNG